jgi:hypothetical protein
MEYATVNDPHRETPMMHYQSDSPGPAPADGTPARDSTTGGRFLRALTRGILGVVLGVWAVVGLVFWIPLLARTMLRFSVALVQATLDGERPTSAARTLQDAVSFYLRGFRVAIEAVDGEPVADSRPAGSIRGRRLVRELVWAGVIWYLILVPLNLAWSPVELWGWLTAWPWGAWVSGVADWFWGVIYG